MPTWNTLANPFNSYLWISNIRDIGYSMGLSFGSFAMLPKFHFYVLGEKFSKYLPITIHVNLGLGYILINLDKLWAITIHRIAMIYTLMYL